MGCLGPMACKPYTFSSLSAAQVHVALLTALSSGVLVVKGLHSHRSIILCRQGLTVTMTSQAG